MTRKLRPRSAYDVMAALSLFIVLGGTSYAVATGSINSREIENNTVRSKDIRNGTVRGKDIRRGAVKSSDISNGALLAEDFKAGQLPTGRTGPAGPQGPKGASGDPLARALGTKTIAVQDNVERWDAAAVVLDESALGRLAARCGDEDAREGYEDAFLMIHWFSPHESFVGLHQDSDEMYFAQATASTLHQPHRDEFRFHLTLNGVHVIYEGFSAMHNPDGGSQSQCQIWGVVRVVKP